MKETTDQEPCLIDNRFTKGTISGNESRRVELHKISKSTTTNLTWMQILYIKNKKNSSDPKSQFGSKSVKVKSKNTQNTVYCENNLNLSGIIPTVMLTTSFRNSNPHPTMQGDLLEVRDKLHSGKALSEAKCTGCIRFQSTYVSQSHRWRLK